MSKMPQLDSDRQQVERLTDVVPPPSFAQSGRAGNACVEQYELRESLILSGQIDQQYVPAYLAFDPDFAAWYRERAAKRSAA